MEIALWVAQISLAAVFALSGSMKSTRSEKWLVESGQTGVEGLRLPLTRFIGMSELMGALGLIVPWAAGVGLVLTPVAALGLGLIMVPAAVIHYRRRELGNVVTNVAILAGCLFVSYGRMEDLGII